MALLSPKAILIAEGRVKPCSRVALYGCVYSCNSLSVEHRKCSATYERVPDTAFGQGQLSATGAEFAKKEQQQQQQQRQQQQQQNQEQLQQYPSIQFIQLGEADWDLPTFVSSLASMGTVERC